MIWRSIGSRDSLTCQMWGVQDTVMKDKVTEMGKIGRGVGWQK